ncbi:unnamed protein product [Paramecium primaurelia]|uniref:Peptidase A1 domain-containing protein n=1 Tax=Paramecium primaurelia TaxID=5886 RepID=A0A8S1KIX6_PARPR|nr:unnamed protein product [Paramecium primaurelia]
MCNNKSMTLEKCNEVEDLQCQKLLTTYDGESIRTINVSDIIKIGENNIKFDFECILDSGSQLLGMGNQNSFIDVLYKKFQFKSQHKIFSILLKNENGKLTIGQDYPNYDEITIPFDKHSKYYQIDLATVTDDENNVVFQPNQFENYQIIVDTGSTLINMDSETLQSFQKSFAKCQQDIRGCPQELNYDGYQCYYYDRIRYGYISNFYETFPEFSFNFQNGYQYKLNAKDYLLNPQQDLYCLPFFDHTRNYEPKFQKTILLGQPFMNNKEFYFDLTDSKIFIKNPEAKQNTLQIRNLSDIVQNYYIYVEIGLLIGIYLFYRKYSVQIRGIFRSARTNQGFNPYA